MPNQGETASLTYEEMLAALQELLGERVAVVIMLQIQGHPRAREIAALYGPLHSAETTDLSRSEGQTTGFAPGESVGFIVGEGDNPTHSRFFLRRDDFKMGTRSPDGDLRFRAGKVRFYVTSDPALA